jgi:hypothetical protein
VTQLFQRLLVQVVVEVLVIFLILQIKMGARGDQVVAALTMAPRVLQVQQTKVLQVE